MEPHGVHQADRLAVIVGVEAARPVSERGLEAGAANEWCIALVRVDFGRGEQAQAIVSILFTTRTAAPESPLPLGGLPGLYPGRQLCQFSL